MQYRMLIAQNKRCFHAFRLAYGIASQCGRGEGFRIGFLTD